MSERKEKIWYASYGSNLLAERFACYIQGGQPIGSQHVHPGCRDQTLPEKSEPLIIPRQLYFANRAMGWDRHGVGFISNEVDTSVRTIGRKHLITKDQFIDVLKQENKNHEDFDLDFEKTIQAGYSKVKDNNWYAQMIYLGHEQGYPVFSFTALRDMYDRINKPNHAYLKIIIEGIKQTNQLGDQDILDYLMPLKGIYGEYSSDELMGLIKKEFSF